MFKKSWLPITLLHTALISAAMLSGCSAHVSTGYRVYDPYYTDYHVWGPDEDVYYHRWLGERHYDYKDFRKLPADRQKDYWNWRHNHPEQPHP